MNNKEQKDSLLLFFIEFLKSNNCYEEDYLNECRTQFTIENVNQWITIYTCVKNTSQSYNNNLVNNWIPCVDYIIKNNLIMLYNSHIKVNDVECYNNKETSGDCGSCIFESCDLTELCLCIPCSGGYYKAYSSCNDDHHKECIPLEKDNSTGKKYDTGKTRYDLLPPEIMKEIAEILTFGAAKYGDNNWQKLEDFNNRYYAAMERHIQAWRMGEDFDPESGKHHLSHALTNVAFLVWKNINKE